MKKHLKVALVAAASMVLALALCACGGKDNSGSDDSGLKAPISADDAVDMNYEEVVDLFSKAGFTNIEAIPIYDLEDRETDKQNTVTEILINDETFAKDASFEPEASVVLGYHEFASEDPGVDDDTPYTPPADYKPINKIKVYAGDNNANIAKKTITLKQGETVKLTFKTSPGEYADVDIYTDDEGIIEIAQDGTITALKSGTAKVNIDIFDTEYESKYVYVKIKVVK